MIQSIMTPYILPMHARARCTTSMFFGRITPWLAKRKTLIGIDEDGKTLWFASKAHLNAFIAKFIDAEAPPAKKIGRPRKAATVTEQPPTS